MLITIWRFRVNSGPTYTAAPALLALPIKERFWSVWWIEAGVKAAITTITTYRKRDNTVVALKVVLLVEKLTN